MAPRSRGSRAGSAVALAVLLVLTACSNDDTAPTAAPTSDGTATTAPPARKPEATPAMLEGPITVGTMNPPADPRPSDLPALGYAQEEFFASGTATAYTASGVQPADGKWTATAASTAPYKTRFVVRRPADASRFDGTVVVEWLNVSVVEAAPDWTYTERALVDAGAAWVGVSVQALGVVGGTSLLQSGSADQQAQTNGGIRGSNPERYGTLEHPGDQYALDIYSQVGAAIRSPGAVPVLGSGRAERVVAAGESQSAAFLTTYIDAIQPMTDVFDGFFVHSRGAGAVGVDGKLGIRGSTGAGVHFRTDLDVPIMAFETETDVGPLLRYALARQADTDRLRTWEVAGTSHADAYLVNGNLSLCPGGINDGPQHYVATAAMADLLRWVGGGAAPPHSPRIAAGGTDGTTVMRDEHGIALGGIRTPSVDVPVETLSGQAQPGAPVLCALFGSATPFDHATVASLYPTPQAYLDAFDRSLAEAIDKGFVRAADRAQYRAEAEAKAATVPF